MRYFLIILVSLICLFGNSQTILSWNIQNLGESKYKKDSVITQISKVLKSSKADIIAIQEVVTGSYGDSCIQKISKNINYSYVISEKTVGDGSERYAFLYNSKTVKLNWSKLDDILKDSIDREPFIASFKYKKKNIIIRQVHLVPTSKNPQKEVSKLYTYSDGIICGDFNLSCKHIIFIPLLTNFNSPLCDKSTTLKRDGNVSENNYDHFFVSKNYTIKESKVFLYTYKGNRNILSDHLPIIIKLN